MSDIKFIDGLIVKAPHDRAPDFVKAKLSIKRAELIAWLEDQDGEWINADVKESRGGKWYVSVDEWKPEREKEPERKGPPVAPPADFDDDIPF
jgi:hypothetical protein